MKNGMIVGGLLAVLLILPACGGSGGGGLSSTQDAACEGSACPPEEDPDGDPGEDLGPGSPLTCGRADETCPDGYRCIDDPAAECDAVNGVDCRGLCVLGEELPGCGGFPGESCPDGYVCADDPADDCAGGPAVDCPGVCQPMASGECSTDYECPVLEAPCSVCADGSVSCVQSRCVDGECTVDFKPCSEPEVCGGISGLSCEPGFRCVDDPTDGCTGEPEDGDCRGICVPDPAPPTCGGFTGEECPPGFECADDPSDSCDPQNGGADCPGICEPAPGEECVSDEECPEVRAPCTVCPDGTDSCPRSVCDHGRCSVIFSGCLPPAGCSSDSDCAPGQICRQESNDACDPATGMACSGVCVPDDGSRSCGGVAGDICPPGYECVDDRSDECAPDAGADCPGVCVPDSPAECVTDRGCVVIESCRPCPDGSSLSCPTAECLNGKCAVSYEPCSDPGFCGGIAGFPCPPGLICVDDRGDDCDPNEGGADCAGICVPESPSECTSDGDCAVTQACRTCPDGSFSCPSAVCVNGKCAALEPGCPPAGTCGGIAGFTCPPGFTCIDDDGDDCDPNQGGADCGGVCIREHDPAKCGGFAGEACEEGYECVDAPDDCDPATMGADCPGYCRPASGTSCNNDADCPAIGAPCQVCDDGTAACPGSFCEAGDCRVDFPTCAGTDPDR
jgi:hypothetical protein